MMTMNKYNKLKRSKYIDMKLEIAFALLFPLYIMYCFYGQLLPFEIVAGGEATYFASLDVGEESPQVLIDMLAGGLPAELE